MNKVYKASRKAPSVMGSISKRALTVTLTDNSIIYKTGILSKKTNEIPYPKINSVSVKQGLLERSLGYGDVIILAGNDVNGIVLENIDNPTDLRDDIMSMINR